VISLTAAACGFTAAPVRYFEVGPGTIERQTGPQLPAVLVPDFDCAPAYDNLRLVMRRSPVEVSTTRNLQWTTAPGRMLAHGLRRQLEGTGRFEAVGRAVTPPPPYRVEGFVRAIELDKQPTLTARLALDVSVRRTADGRVIHEDLVAQSRAASGQKPADGVLALRELYGIMLQGISARIIAAIETDQHERQ
jgi:ABC-type uncharacterized transport system auxiliary subunit